MRTDVSKYYTPKKIADLIVSQLECCPGAIVDICAGSWNLLKSAADRWPSATYTGVDVRPVEFPLDMGSVQAESIVHDGRSFVIGEVAQGKRYDLVLGNPPFGHENLDPLILGGLSALGISQAVLTGITCSRLEATMLLANAELVADNGTMAIILPDTLLSSERFTPLRLHLSQHLRLVKLLRLPDKTFGRKNTIHTYVAIFTKTQGTQGSVPVLQVVETKADDVPEAKEIAEISAALVIQGCWISAELESREIAFDLTIQRGKVGTHKFSPTKPGRGVVHSTNVLALYRNQALGTRYYLDSDDKGLYPATEPGDLLVVRVGRDAGTVLRWDFEESLVISDCLFILRPQSREAGDYLLRQVRSGIIDLTGMARGVAARHVTLRSLEKVFQGTR